MGGSGSKNYLSGSNKPTKPTVPGSGLGGNGGSGGGGGDVCAIITSGTLRSPNPLVVSTLAAGNDLGVQIIPVSGLDVLQAVNAAGVGVGVIDTPDEQQLIDCILAGNEYKATVIRVSGGAVSVRISRI